ncbi:phospholipid scramblase 2 isoform X3 [Halyomorpha halys]|uniref:phospholipid scramblase 2 isoform X3 n=1 Tax=Halyomorpha halys TaxID=286706 RepID=UPI0006D4EDA5|nr:phospholipid scramblase 2 isoform X3 [Halyomorpha halys]
MTSYPDPNSGMYPPPYPGGPGGYPPSQGYPPAGYPPPGGYGPPQGGGYPPAQGGYGPPQGGYPPPQGGFPPGPGFAPPPNQAAYPPGGYQPAPNSYPPPGGYGAPTAPISTQPTSGAQDGWMSSPQTRPVNCPPGLEYLTTIDQLLVHQKVELLEAFTGFETQNKFTVKNSLGQKVFYAVEDSGCLTRCCCGPWRPFDMKILDNFRNEVIHLYRPLACDSCWFPCCLQKLEVYAPLGTLAGTIEQEWSILTPQYSVKNAAGDTVLRIEGPFCTFTMCGDVEFKVLTLDGAVVGKITKQWSGLLREMFTDADYFGITFPMDLDVKIKAVMLGACFLIDYMFFEKKGNREDDRPGMF